ncbi:hypothetical protein [Pseudoalteromonas 'SMAR']|uniref:hypothetical protein n=1 Tax=Pseudoalteromonas 'SMAR' TaxID=3416908 RepID=UPI003AF1FAA6
MLWSIFIITTLLLSIYVLAKVYALLNGEYSHQPVLEVIQDIFDIVISVIGCTAIYYGAIGENLASQRFWQGFFIINVVLVLLCYFSPKFKSLKAELGGVTTIKIIALNLTLSLPFLYGLYYYAFIHTW